MKIAFVGKGGSGKTTISSLVIQKLLEHGDRVLAIDSDINQHLASALQLDIEQIKNIKPIGNSIAFVTECLRGENTRITNPAKFIRTTPPGIGSNVIALQQLESFFAPYLHTQNNLQFMAVGQPEDTQVAKQCYHVNMSAVTMLLNHLVDLENEHIIVDLTAGIDTVISGMFVSYDLVFVVVEPTLKSLSVYNDYVNYSKRLGFTTKIIPIANKVFDTTDLEFIAESIKATPLATIGQSSYIRNLERGIQKPFSDVELETHQALEVITTYIKSQQKDWEKFYEYMVKVHKLKAEDKKDAELLEQIDPEFNFQKVIEKIKTKTKQGA